MMWLKWCFKEAVCDKLVPKVNNIDTSGFILKTKYDTDKAELEKKIPDVTVLVKKTKLIELENKIPDVSGLARKSALTVVENKIPDVRSSVKKTDYNRGITEIETKITDHNDDKYTTTPEFNKLTAENFAAGLKQANLATKTDFDGELKRLNQKINSSKIKHLVVENELEKLKAFYSCYFIGKIHFEEDGTITYLANVQIF